MVSAGETLPQAPVTGDAACVELVKLLEQNQVSSAIEKMSSCHVGRGSAMLRRIDEQVLRIFNEKGCETKPLIKAASQIGALSARQPYVDKGCR